VCCTWAEKIEILVATAQIPIDLQDELHQLVEIDIDSPFSNQPFIRSRKPYPPILAEEQFKLNYGG